MAKTVDFSKVPVEYRIGEPEAIDIRHAVGNAINQHTHDIGVMEFARTVYYSDQPIEIPAEYVNAVIRGIMESETVLAAAKVAAVNLIRDSLGHVPAEPAESCNPQIIEK